MGNVQDQVAFEKGSFLEGFFEKSKGKSADEIAELLEKDETLAETHLTAARDGQSQVEAIETPINTHFICFSVVDGHLYELDGRKKFPINHGASSRDTLLEVHCR